MCCSFGGSGFISLIGVPDEQEGWRPAVFSNMPQFGGCVLPDDELHVSATSFYVRDVLSSLAQCLIASLSVFRFGMRQ